MTGPFVSLLVPFAAAAAFAVLGVFVGGFVRLVEPDDPEAFSTYPIGGAILGFIAGAITAAAMLTG